MKKCAFCGREFADDELPSGMMMFHRNLKDEAWLCSDMCWRRYCSKHVTKTKPKQKYSWFRGVR